MAIEPKMLIVSDIANVHSVEDVFLPAPEHLTVNLEEGRAVIESLLSKLSSMHAGTQNPNSAMGVGLLCAEKLMSAMGGKIITFCCTMPNVHVGALKSRDDPKLLGSPKESSLLNPSLSFYKHLAVDMQKVGVSVDLFAFGDSYMDLATIGTI